MVKEFRDNSNNSGQRGFSRGGRGGRGDRGGYNNRFQQQGPPSYVIPFCTYEHPSQNQILVKATDKTRVPKFNRGIYLQSKAKVGIVDQILGPIDNYYFSAKLEEGVNPSSFKKGQVFYMAPEDLLPLDRFLPKPKIPGMKGPSRGGARGGGFRGAPRGGQRGGPRGFSRGAPRGNFRGGRGGR